MNFGSFIGENSTLSSFLSSIEIGSADGNRNKIRSLQDIGSKARSHNRTDLVQSSHKTLLWPRNNTVPHLYLFALRRLNGRTPLPEYSCVPRFWQLCISLTARSKSSCTVIIFPEGSGGPDGSRTRLSGLKGQRANQCTTGPRSQNTRKENRRPRGAVGVIERARRV